jgi:dynein heavy chain
MIALVGT